MSTTADAISLGAAFAAGVAASGHCVGMCGGIAGALALRARQTTTGHSTLVALTYNLSRITSYTVAGVVAGLLGATLLRAVNVVPLSIGLRVAAGFIMLAAAGRLMFGWRLLDPIEAAGSRLWSRIAPRASAPGRAGGLGGAVGLGLAWGWLPCGMTYSMLLLAATTASPASGAIVMAAFGVGTLPSMVTASLAFDRVSRLVARRAAVRNVAGALLLAFGLWTAGEALYHGLVHEHGAAGHEHHHPAPGS